MNKSRSSKVFGGGTCPSCPGVSVDVITGELELQANKPSLPSLGFPVELDWSWRSQDLYKGAFGRGRSRIGEIGQQVHDLSNGDAYGTVVLRKDSGEFVFYDGYGDWTSWIPALGYYNSLTKNGDGSWTESRPNGVSLEYDGYGFLTRMTGPMGHAHYYEYDSYGKVARLLDASGRTAYFEYDSYGVTAFSDWASRTTYFEYDPVSGAASQIKGPEGCTTGFTYNADHRVTSISDPDGFTAYYEYDAAGKVASETIPGVGTTYFNYDTANKVTAVIDPLGRPTYYCYDGDTITQVTNALGEVEQYAGLVTAVDASGRATYYAYDAFGNRTESADLLGYSTKSAYNDFGSPVTQTDQVENTSYYEYDSYGNLTCEMDREGNAAYYEYNADGLITAQTDALGRSTYYEYDSFGRRTSLTDALGRSTYFEYDLADELTKQVNARGFAAYYEYDKVGRLTKTKDALLHATETGYTGSGQVSVQIDARGNATYYEYNAFRQQTAVTDAEGHTTYLEYNPAAQHTATVNPRNFPTYYYYDAAGRQKGTIDALSNQAYYVFDAAGRTTVTVDARGSATYMAYDPAGRLTSRIDALGNATYYLYDPKGNLCAVTDPLGRTTQTVPDRNDRVTGTYHSNAGYGLQPYGVSAYGGGGVALSASEYDAAGNVVATTDAMGDSTHYQYDALNRRTGVTDALGDQTYFEFDEVGNTIRTADARGNNTYFGYDAVNRLTVRTDALLNSTYYTYDENGNTLSVTDQLGHTSYLYYDKVNRGRGAINALGHEAYFEFDAAGNRTALVSPRGYASYFAYDALNRLEGNADAEGVAAYFVYDANSNRTCSTLGVGAEARHTYFDYDALNRMTSTTAPDGGIAYFGYDEVGNRTFLENPLDATTYYGYDDFDRVVSATDPLGKTVYYTYDLAGNLTAKISPASISYMEYDALGHRAKTHYDDGFAAYFEYDEVGNLLTANELSGGTVYFAYDELNRVTSQKFDVGGAAYYGYDAAGNRLHIVYPSGGAAYYAYDELNRISSVQAPSGQMTTCEYDASSNRTKSVWGNDSYTYYAYDKAERVSSIRHFDDADAPLAYFDFGRDGRGNITHIARLDGETSYYGYDDADRLASETWKDSGGSTIYGFTYEYDKNGNRTAASLLGEATYYAYNAADELLTKTDSTGTAYYTYDDGNLERSIEPGGAVTYFEHASHDLISKITPLGDNEVTFGYDALLRRTTMTEAGITTYFRHDGINILEMTTSDGHTTKLTHGHATIDGIGSVIEMQIDGSPYYLHNDHRGTTYKITDADGDVVWSGLCDVWGRVITETGTNPGIFWYQGQAWFRKTINGRSYYISPVRVYDPVLGIWLQRDPIRYRNGMNLYGSFGGNPIAYADPQGLSIITTLLRLTPRPVEPDDPAHSQGMREMEMVARGEWIPPVPRCDCPSVAGMDYDPSVWNPDANARRDLDIGCFGNSPTPSAPPVAAGGATGRWETISATRQTSSAMNPSLRIKIQDGTFASATVTGNVFEDALQKDKSVTDLGIAKTTSEYAIAKYELPVQYGHGNCSVGLKGTLAEAKTRTRIGCKLAGLTAAAGGTKDELGARLGLIDHSLGFQAEANFLKGTSGVGVNILGIHIELQGSAAIGVCAKLQVGKHCRLGVGPLQLALTFGWAE